MIKRIFTSRIVWLGFGLLAGFFGGALWLANKDLALDRAVANGDLVAVKQALEDGADPNKIVVPPNFESAARKVLGFGPVRQERAVVAAAQAGHTDIVRELLRAGANPNGHDGTGYTAMAVAMHDDNAELCKLLLEFKADPNPRFKDGSTFGEEAGPKVKRLIRDFLARKS